MKQLFNDKNRTIVDVNIFDMIQKDDITYYSYKDKDTKEKQAMYRIVLSKISTNYDEYNRSVTDAFTVALSYDTEKKRNADYNKILNNYKTRPTFKNYIPWDKPVPMELWPDVIQYYHYDIEATEATTGEQEGPHNREVK